MGKRSQSGQEARKTNSYWGQETPGRVFLKWLAGMVAEKLIAREGDKQPPKKKK